MSYSKDREEFVYRMSRHDGFPLSSLRRILKYAGIIHRAAEVACSVPLDGPAQDRMERAVKDARSMLAGAMPSGWGLETSGDPRGYTVKMYAPGEDMESGMGIGVPAQGYSASQMARMTGRS